MRIDTSGSGVPILRPDYGKHSACIIDRRIELIGIPDHKHKTDVRFKTTIDFARHSLVSLTMREPPLIRETRLVRIKAFSHVILRVFSGPFFFFFCFLEALSGTRCRWGASQSVRIRVSRRLRFSCSNDPPAKFEPFSPDAPVPTERRETWRINTRCSRLRLREHHRCNATNGGRRSPDWG